MREAYKSKVFKHKTKRRALFKFIAVLAVLFLYALFVISKYGVEQGLQVSFLTWSFFVLCTPVADAGFLIDFPIRLITKMKMLYSEILVWLLAISMNLYYFFFNPAVYEKDTLLNIFYKILSTPWPYWLLILLSFFGTFLSILFGDELMDTISHKERKKHSAHKNKYAIIAMLAFALFVIFLYRELLADLDIKLALW